MKLLPSLMSDARIRSLVAAATRDAFNAGRAMTLRPVECVL